MPCHVQLQLVVLLRHTIAGHAISLADIARVFGPVLTAASAPEEATEEDGEAEAAVVVPPALWRALHNWLRCNRRTRDNILRPTTHPAYLEQALVRLYSLWPRLLVAPAAADRPSVFVLQWDNRLQSQNAFRSPDTYQPNLNRL